MTRKSRQALLAVMIGAFLVSILRGLVEDRVSSAYGSSVTISTIERDSLFSYHPLISFQTLGIAQPAAAGPGDPLGMDAASVRLPVLKLLTG